MRYHALATDYDGTLAHDGRVASHILDALQRLKASGRKLILVTGRELDELKSIFPEITLFDRVVAENGALLYRPATLEEKLLGEPPPASFVELLKRKGVAPMSVGRVIVATWEPHQHSVLSAIQELSLERQVIFNKGAVMVLPSGINKAKGLEAALEELCLSLHNVVSVGDAENDNAMLEASECAVAVSNALPRLKEHADWVTQADHGNGVVELIERLLENDLSEIQFQQPEKRQLVLGTHADGSDVQICPYGVSMLLAGTSGGGKSTFTTAFLERLVDLKYQFCLVDPEGDYLTLEGTIVLGDTEHPPVIEEVLKLLEKPGQSTVVCTLAIPFQDRPAFFHKLLPAILELRSRTGRPHWLILDEAHHLLPASRTPTLFNVPQDLQGFLLITTQPNLINQSILGLVNLIIAIGEAPNQTISTFAEVIGEKAPAITVPSLERGEAIVWSRSPASAPFWMRSHTPRQEQRRHQRKYSAGDMGLGNSFYFRGPQGKLNLQAQNLVIFIQMAEGVDDETWLYHLKRKDYSQWFRSVIKDPSLADEAETIEKADRTVQESRAAIRKIIEKRYTAPA